MMSASSWEISRHQRSSQRSLNHFHIQFALARQASKREVAAAQKAGDGVVRIGAIAQVQLGVQLVAQEQLHDQPSGPELRAQAAQPFVISVRGSADQQLFAEVLSDTCFEADDRRLINALTTLEAKDLAQLILWLILHANEQPARSILATLPVLHEGIDMPPAAQIEIPNTKVSMF